MYVSSTLQEPPTGLANPLLEFRYKALDPSIDRAGCNGDAALGHHLRQIPIAQSMRHVPAHAQHDQVLVEMPVAEGFIGVA